MDPRLNFAHEVWIHYNHFNEPLNSFLQRNRPSQITGDKATWISVSTRKYSFGDDKEDDEEENDDDDKGYDDDDDEEEEEEEDDGDDEKPRRIAMLAEWNRLVENRSVQPVTTETVKELGIKYKITTGKWLIFANSYLIDAVWSKIAKGIVEGKLGFSAKVSTKNPKPHVICVYTEDFADEDDVRKMEKALRELGIDHFMQYKADVYTYLDIYRNNKFGIPPCIYQSEAVKEENGKWNTRPNAKWDARRDGTEWNARSNTERDARSKVRWDERRDVRRDARSDGTEWDARSNTERDARPNAKWSARPHNWTTFRSNAKGGASSNLKEDSSSNAACHSSSDAKSDAKFTRKQYFPLLRNIDSEL